MLVRSVSSTFPSERRSKVIVYQSRVVMTIPGAASVRAILSVFHVESSEEQEVHCRFSLSRATTKCV